MREFALTRTGGSPRTPWFIRGLWFVLGVVMLLLFLLAGLLLFKSGLLSTSRLTDEQTKPVWAFLGVAGGFVVTLFGTLLSYESTRKEQALAEDREKRLEIDREKQLALAKETEQRLVIDTVAKVLELITIDGAYAPRARVGGAIATMVELQGGKVAVRILRELWAANAVDSDTAIWLIDRVLQDATDEDWKAPEVEDAIWLLSRNATKLVPAKPKEGQAKEDQGWYLWPTAVEDEWPDKLPKEPRKSLVVAAVKVLLARDMGYWKFQGHRFAINTLVYALEESPEGGRSDGLCPEVGAARVLASLLEYGALETLHPEAVTDETTARIRELSGESVPPWFEELISEFESWSKGQPTDHDQAGS